MACSCGIDGLRQTEARRLRIYRRIGFGPMLDLTQAIIMSLAFDFQAEVNVGADMWFGVWLRSPYGDVDVQCDWIEDGLAAAWEYLADRHPELVSVRKDWRGDPSIVERFSAGALKLYEDVENDYKAHRTAAHVDDNDCPPCEDCDILRDLQVTVSKTLQDLWGAEVMLKEMEKVYRR